MGRKIEIDEDVYQYLASQTREIGESASSILRRLLRLREEEAAGPEPVRSPASPHHEFSSLFNSAAFRRGNGVTRFLAILQEAFKQRPDRIGAVLKVQGKKRLYFARSARDIEASGNSTAPKAVGGSGIWVTTNTSSALKGRIIYESLQAMGFSGEACEAAREVCAKA